MLSLDHYLLLAWSFHSLYILISDACPRSAAGPAAAAACEHERGIELSALFTASRRASGVASARGKALQPRTRPGMIVRRSRWSGVVWVAVGTGELIGTSPSRPRCTTPRCAAVGGSPRERKAVGPRGVALRSRSRRGE